MDARVSATVKLHLAKAELAVASLERLEAETPSLRGNSDQRIRIGRRLRVARALSDSWSHVLDLIDWDHTGAGQDTIKESSPAPDRIVAQAVYVADGPDRFYCNRDVCYSMAHRYELLTPLAAYDLPEGGVCSHCGTDVLA